MSLTSELAAFREKSDKELFPETRRILEEAAADLGEKKAGENAMGVSDKFPDATLTDHHGRPWRFKDALANGPLLVVFYRGGGGVPTAISNSGPIKPCCPTSWAVAVNL